MQSKQSAYIQYYPVLWYGLNRLVLTSSESVVTLSHYTLKSLNYVDPSF